MSSWGRNSSNCFEYGLALVFATKLDYKGKIQLFGAIKNENPLNFDEKRGESARCVSHISNLFSLSNESINLDPTTVF
jgi:hypothetical protein